jgi:hypothetical protein
MELWTDFLIELSTDDILRGEGVDLEITHTKRPAMIKTASAAKVLGFTKIKPLVATQEAKILEHHHDEIIIAKGKKMTGSMIARSLAGAEKIIAVVCTIGADLEKLSAATMAIDPLLTLALEGLGNAALESVLQQVCERISEKTQETGLNASVPLYPGETGWPVDKGQSQLFSLFESHPAGVNLTEGAMMIPRKSISFLIGIGTNMKNTAPCSRCSMKDRCRYQHG